MWFKLKSGPLHEHVMMFSYLAPSISCAIRAYDYDDLVTMVTYLPFQVGDVIHDVVIHANPASPPYSLIYLYKSLQMQYSCRTAIHIHSSVKSVPDRLMDCLGNGVRIERPKAQIALTLIWKDGKKVFLLFSKRC